ncbi:MAG: 30S ribosomal protein S3 [Candidatus Absconditabacteria bacterium]
MGHKVDPRGFRIGFVKSWPCEWFAKNKRQTEEFFLEDHSLRTFIDKFFGRAGIGKVVIRRNEKESEVLIFTAKPALVIGKDGTKLQDFQNSIESKFKKTFKIIVKEIKTPEHSAKIMGEFACEQLEKRVPFRRVAKGVLQKCMEKGVTGVKIQVGGRLGGVDLSRVEKFIEGRVPLQTIRSDIDYHYTTALTKYGILGVKVWIYKGDVTMAPKGQNKKSLTKKILKKEEEDAN